MSEIQRQGTTRRWSDLVIHHGTVYFVEVADDPTADAQGQFEQLFRQVEERLAEAGSSLDRLLQVLIYLPYPEDFSLFNQMWDDWIPFGHAPVRACINARLMNKDYRAELIVTAACGASC